MFVIDSEPDVNKKTVTPEMCEDQKSSFYYSDLNSIITKANLNEAPVYLYFTNP